jgi:hypothetical protein
VCDGDAEEGRALGAVGWGVYASYFKAVGVVMCCAVLGSLLAMQVKGWGLFLDEGCGLYQQLLHVL